MPDGRRDLAERTFAFARDVRAFANEVLRTPSNWEDMRQVIRSSGSVAANYLEAQEGLSRKDFFYRIRVCRKEARESELWLRLIDVGVSNEVTARREELSREAVELKKIFAAIALKDDTGVH